MKKFEYQILEDKGNWKQPILDQMQALGAEGWELVSVQSWPNLTEYYYKREICTDKPTGWYWSYHLAMILAIIYLSLCIGEFIYTYSG